MLRRLLFLFALLLLGGTRAFAHAAPGDSLFLDLDSRGVTMQIWTPLVELEMGYGKPLNADPAGALAREERGIVAYVLRNTRIAGLDGRPWRLEPVGPIRISGQKYPIEYILTLRATAPRAGWTDFDLRYDTIGEKVPNHQADVWIRSNSLADPPLRSPQLLKTLRFLDHTVGVHRDPPTFVESFRMTFVKGMRHIAEGTDHLLFLLALLLPAPLLAAGGRWGGYAGGRVALRRIAKVVTAFTVGHSITLVLGALGWAHLPSALIESAIALSIFVSAIHALVPIFRGREILIAGGFGLVHGLSFASALSEFGFDPLSLVSSVLGFNLGIEAFQLFVILVAMPWLVLLARTRVYPAFRVAGALVTGLAAATWFGERALGWANPVGPVVEAVAAHAPVVVATLAAVSLLAYGIPRLRAPQPATG